MSIVTCGLSQPVALMPSSGLGIGQTVIVVVPIEQATTALETLVSAGVQERDINVTALDPEASVVAIQYVVDPDVALPIQTSAVIDRFLSIAASQPELDVTVTEVNQTAKLVEVLQTAVTIAPSMAIQVIEVSDDVDVNEAIDKVQD